MRKSCAPWSVLASLAVLALAPPVLAGEAPIQPVDPPAAVAPPVTEADLFGSAAPGLSSLTPAPAPAFVPCIVIKVTCEPCPHGAQQKTCYDLFNCPDYCTACSNYC